MRGVRAGPAELGRKPVIDDWVETYIFQSDKCFASFAVK
jgi:hypothetical protein